MAWYQIKGSCGHDFRKQLYGKETERQKYIDWANDRLECPECYKTRLENERKAVYEAASEKSKEENLPQLEGSAKQIQWAESIRIAKLELLRKCAGENADDSEIIEKIKFFVDCVKSRKEAKWFIDNKNSFYSKEYFLEKIRIDKAKESGKDLVG